MAKRERESISASDVGEMLGEVTTPVEPEAPGDPSVVVPVEAHLTREDVEEIVRKRVLELLPTEAQVVAAIKAEVSDALPKVVGALPRVESVAQPTQRDPELRAAIRFLVGSMLTPGQQDAMRTSFPGIFKE